jgi:hypothetical protein
MDTKGLPTKDGGLIGSAADVEDDDEHADGN